MVTCPAGTYSPPHSDRCFDCRAGHYCPNEATTQVAYEAALCEGGKTCGSKTTVSTTCPEGYFCKEGAWRAEECPVGTFASAAGYSQLSQCTAAPVGKYTDLRASLAIQVTDNECEFGHRCPEGAHSGFQEACPAGYYQDERGQGSCKTCPAGRYCDGTTMWPV